jgi:hypothetical protein
MKKTATLAVLAAAIIFTAACTATETNDALPTGSDQFPTSTTVAAGTVKTEAAKVTTTTEPAPAASTCDVTREALLTGTQAEITASLKALMADKTADATAREYADYYLNRDKASPDMREMDIGLIRMSCSL